MISQMVKCCRRTFRSSQIGSRESVIARELIAMGAIINRDILSWSKPVEVQAGASIVGSGASAGVQW